ncbi:MAG: hypothetical protein ACFFDN_20960 [Candidatus Hodarchaeota archaeon]
MQVDKEEISVKDKPLRVNSIRIDNKVLTKIGRLIKTARIEEEWYEDVEDPESLIQVLKDANAKANIFTFW